MESDEKDKVIEHLRFELTRHKDMLTQVYEKKKRWEKQKAEYGERYTRLNNENQKLRAKIVKLTGELPPIELSPMLPDPPAKPFARRRWKGREDEGNDAGLAA